MALASCKGFITMQYFPLPGKRQGERSLRRGGFGEELCGSPGEVGKALPLDAGRCGGSSNPQSKQCQLTHTAWDAMASHLPAQLPWENMLAYYERAVASFQLKVVLVTQMAM